MADFNAAVKKTLEVEGVFDNHPDDTGGKTKYGITEAVARAHGYTGAMEDLTVEQAVQIYKVSYWYPLHLDEITDQAIAEEIFDSGVNLGIGTVTRFLQSALNLLNKRESLWPDLLEDGAMGQKTRDAINACIGADSRYRTALLKALNGEQYERYKAITKANPKNETFFLGWLLKRIT